MEEVSRLKKMSSAKTDVEKIKDFFKLWESNKIWLSSMSYWIALLTYRRQLSCMDSDNFTRIIGSFIINDWMPSMEDETSVSKPDMLMEMSQRFIEASGGYFIGINTKEMKKYEGELKVLARNLSKSETASTIHGRYLNTRLTERTRGIKNIFTPIVTDLVCKIGLRIDNCETMIKERESKGISPNITEPTTSPEKSPEFNQPPTPTARKSPLSLDRPIPEPNEMTRHEARSKKKVIEEEQVTEQSDQDMSLSLSQASQDLPCSSQKTPRSVPRNLPGNQDMCLTSILDDETNIPFYPSLGPPSHTCSFILCKRFLMNYLKNTWNSHDYCTYKSLVAQNKVKEAWAFIEPYAIQVTQSKLPFQQVSSTGEESVTASILKDVLEHSVFLTQPQEGLRALTRDLQGMIQSLTSIIAEATQGRINARGQDVTNRANFKDLVKKNY